MAERKRALVVGANRGIGLGVVKEFLGRGWDVIATARQPAKAAELKAVAERSPGHVTILKLEMNDPVELDGFASGLGSQMLDVALINAGISGPGQRDASTVTAEEIGSLMFTNAIAPIRLARTLVSHIRPGSGVLAFSSSVMGSISLNSGGQELYRASKAALNLLTRGFYLEVRGRDLTVLSLHPGWVRTDMGGPSAAVSVEDSARGIATVLLREQGTHRHGYVDYQGAEITW
jgi:NAD(P)-dependent dehydrogenase (short-subunit alcohol dehydrogenase family)